MFLLSPCLCPLHSSHETGGPSRSLGPEKNETQGQRPGNQWEEEKGTLVSGSVLYRHSQPPPQSPQKTYLTPRQFRAQYRKRVPGQRVKHFQQSPNVHPSMKFLVKLPTQLWLEMGTQAIGEGKVLEQQCGFSAVVFYQHVVFSISDGSLAMTFCRLMTGLRPQDREDDLSPPH